MSWRDKLGNHVRRMSARQAVTALKHVRARDRLGEKQPEVSRLTGLPPSRITVAVIQHVREKLKARAMSGMSEGSVVRQFDPTEQAD